MARTKNRVLLASDGLSDPWDDEDSGEGNGLGLELFAITDDPLPKLPGTWLWDLVWQMSQFAAKNGQISEILDDLGLVSTELYDSYSKDRYKGRIASFNLGRLGGTERVVIPYPG